MRHLNMKFIEKQFKGQIYFSNHFTYIWYQIILWQNYYAPFHKSILIGFDINMSKSKLINKQTWLLIG